MAYDSHENGDRDQKNAPYDWQVVAPWWSLKIGWGPNDWKIRRWRLLGSLGSCYWMKVKDLIKIKQTKTWKMLCMGNKWWLRSEVLLEIFHHTHRKLTYPSESWGSRGFQFHISTVPQSHNCLIPMGAREFSLHMFSGSQVGKTTHWVPWALGYLIPRLAAILGLVITQ